jgi:hypothetical protein
MAGAAVTIKHVPSRLEFEALRAAMPAGPIVTVALLRFKPGVEPRAAYQRYTALASSLSDAGRVEVLHVGEVWADVLSGQTWDYMIVARYASLEDFGRVVLNPRYQSEGAALRDQALQSAVTLVSRACQFSDLWAAGAEERLSGHS